MALGTGTGTPHSHRRRRRLRPLTHPAVGDLRFAHPEPAVLTSPVNATALPNACMQKVNPLTFGAPGISEDCLYLNVVTPPGASTAGGPGLPVMVYM